MTRILPCTCRHPGQDRIHGRGQRVHNFAAGGTKSGRARGWRCTVCSDAKPESAS